MSEASETLRRTTVRAIQLASMAHFQGDGRVIGEDVDLKELAEMFAGALRDATYASFDAGYELGKKHAEQQAEHQRIELEHWHNG